MFGDGIGDRPDRVRCVRVQVVRYEAKIVLGLGLFGNRQTEDVANGVPFR